MDEYFYISRLDQDCYSSLPAGILCSFERKVNVHE
jgi:hypothetical protein